MNRRESLKLMAAVAGSAVLAPSRLFGLQLGDVASAQSAPAGPAFSWMPFGEVRPDGWIKEQMVRDLKEGFAGCLGKLCHEASSDIFVSNRNSLHSKNEANREGSAWWNGETEGNWRAGFIMLAYLAEDAVAMREADDYVRHILSSQGEDGYLGIFAPDSRFAHPGELWTQACLLRGLLDYSELANRPDVERAVRRCCDLIISVYGAGKTPVPWGENHDLMISDVMERLFYLTGDAKYRDFTLWLYETWSQRVSKADTSLPSLLNRKAPFVDHGVHTYESIRLPLWLASATGREDLGQAARNALGKMGRYEEVGGSEVSEELISNQSPDPTYSEYEYCASKETQLTLESALQKTGVASLGDHIERVWFNDAQGSRTADGKAISYLTPDNRLRCDGLTPDGTRAEPRNKFSPTHADVAVCCNPNATNVAALFVRGMWMRREDETLVALLYGPCTVSTRIAGGKVHLEERTHYPFNHEVEIAVTPERATEFSLLLRDPGWSRGTTVTCPGARITREGDYWRVNKRWQTGDKVQLQFVAEVRELPAVNGEVGLQYGALIFARPIAARKAVSKTYQLTGFEDTHYEPALGAQEDLQLPAALRWKGFGFKPVMPSNATELRPFDASAVALRGTMIRKTDGKPVQVKLVPLGNAPLLRLLTHSITS
jgi:DUF1680 family protein